MRPIFNKAPLTPNALAPLPLGAIRSEGWLLGRLEALRAAVEPRLDRIWPTPDEWPEGEALIRAFSALEGMIALAWTLDDEPLKARCAALAGRVLDSQRGDGWFGPADNRDYWPLILALKALRLYFLASGDRRVLVMMDRFFKYQYQNLNTHPLADWAVARGGENMALALWLYNLTGQKHLIELCRRLRGQTLDWPNYFHTFANTVPMSKSLKWARLEDALEEERLELMEGEKRPYFRTQFHLSHGVNIAAGLKTPGVISQFKSGFKEQGGFRFGWEKLSKHHGVASGMFVADAHLNGNNPAQGAGLEACAALLDSLETLLGLGDFNPEYADVLEKAAYNALPAAFTADMSAAQAYQQVNQVKVSRETRRWYNLGVDANLFDKSVTDIPGALAAWPRFAAAQWYATSDGGLQAVSYAPCTVRAVMGSVPVRMRVSGGYPFSQTVEIEVAVKQPCEFPLYLRVPSWSRQPMIFLPEGEIMQVRAGETTCVRRRWRMGDVVRLELPTVPRLTRWYHQSGAVELGPLLMAFSPKVLRMKSEDGVEQLSADAAWNWALVREEPMKAVYTRETDDAFGAGEPPVKVLVKAVPVDWGMEGVSCASVPMVPKIDAARAQVIELVPYGMTELRIAQFPLGRVNSGSAG